MSGVIAVPGEAICAICYKPGGKHCQACGSVCYCSPEHQKQDWKRHKENCCSFVLKSNQELGRHFVAARRIKAGDIILDEIPLVYGPIVSGTEIQNSNATEYCLSCCKIITSIGKTEIRCTKCLWPFFCSFKCTKAPAHTENECKHFAKSKFRYRVSNRLNKSIIYRGIMILRVISQKSKILPKNQGTLWNSIINLQYERADLKLSPANGINCDKDSLAALKAYFKMEDICNNEDDFARVSGAIDVNAFSIDRVEEQDEEPSRVLALFSKSSIFAHSCVPNCTWGIGYSPEFKMRIRAAKTIEKDEILTLSYNSDWSSYGTIKRRKLIRNLAGFECKCARCLDPTELMTFSSSLKCGSSFCDGYISPNVDPNGRYLWECSFSAAGCNHCLSHVNQSGFLDNIQMMEQELNQIYSAQTEYPTHMVTQLLQNFIHICSTNVHSNHWILQQASEKLIHIRGNQIKTLSSEELASFVLQCRFLLQISNILTPGISVKRAIIQLYLSRALFRKYQFSKTQTNSEDLQLLNEIRELQLESFEYWRTDIQSKRLDEPMGYEAVQLSREIVFVTLEYEKVVNNTNSTSLVITQ